LYPQVRLDAAAVFFFDLRSVCVALPFIAASSSTLPKDEVVAAPFQATATMLVIKPLPSVLPPSCGGGSSTDSQPLGATGRPLDAPD